MNIDFNDIWIPSKIRNGRIDILQNIKGGTKIIKPSILNENNASSISRNLQNTSLSIAFFSKENIDEIQCAIINEVYRKTNGKYQIEKQSENELIIIMRSYYLQYGKNLPDNINGQVNKLNNMVINWSSDEIITNIDQYMKYKETVSTLPMPLERSQLSSQKGTKTLEIKSFV
jgi:hypothetical protein